LSVVLSPVFCCNSSSVSIVKNKANACLQRF